MKIKISFILLSILVIAVNVIGCSPKKTGEQPARAAVTELALTGLEAEPEEAQDITAPPVSGFEPALNINQLTQAVSEPRFIDYFKHLDFERKTYSDIRIWGWSRDGKVAYSNFHSHEGDRFTVYIFDMINDKILWQNSLDFFAYYFTIEHDENFDIFKSDFYLDFIDDFKKICIQNGIEFIQTEFMGLPIRHNNQTVNIIIEKNLTSLSFLELEDLRQYGGTIESYKVIAENQGKRKTVHEMIFQIYANDVFACGYFISPFENRALIVIGEFVHGWEESVVTYSLVGCHLSAGF